jgi:hypothetical protein
MNPHSMILELFERPLSGKPGMALTSGNRLESPPSKLPGGQFESPQYLGGNATRSVLEICGSATATRSHPRLLRTEGKQFFRRPDVGKLAEFA